MVSYPSSLPNPLQDSVQYSRAFDNILKSNMEFGIKRRRRFTWVPDLMTVTIYVTRAQLQTFMDFYQITLAEVKPFEWDEWRSSLPLTTVYTFDGPPEYQFVGNDLLRVSFTLRIMKKFDGTSVIDVAGLEGYYST